MAQSPSVLNISEKLRKNVERIYDDIGLRHVFEEHLDYLYQNGEVHQVDPSEADRFHRDLNGYLYQMGVPLGLHWLYMRLNNMTYPSDFTRDTVYLIKPTDSAIDTIVGQYQLLRTSY